MSPLRSTLAALAAALMLAAVMAAMSPAASAQQATGQPAVGRVAQEGCPAILDERRTRARQDLNRLKRSIRSHTKAVANYGKAKKNAKTRAGRAKAAKKLRDARKRLKISKTALPNIQRRFDAAQGQAVGEGCAP